MECRVNITLTLHQTPPSLNVVGLHSHWRVGHKAKQRLQDDLHWLLVASKLSKGLSRVEASARLTFPTRRRRDEGNWRSLIEKALGDALVAGGWLSDDTPDRYRFGACLIDTTPGPARTVISVVGEVA